MQKEREKLFFVLNLEEEEQKSNNSKESIPNFKETVVQVTPT